MARILNRDESCEISFGSYCDPDFLSSPVLIGTLSEVSICPTVRSKTSIVFLFLFLFFLFTFIRSSKQKRLPWFRPSANKCGRNNSSQWESHKEDKFLLRRFETQRFRIVSSFNNFTWYLIRHRRCCRGPISYGTVRYARGICRDFILNSFYSLGRLNLL